MFEAIDYKDVVNTWIKAQPKNGRGQLRKIAEVLKVNSVVTSQIFRGERHLNLDQGLIVARYLGLSNIERDYFLLLIQKERAGTFALKNLLQSQLDSIKKSAKNLEKIIEHKELTINDRALFYSNWYYSAIRLATDIPDLNTVHELSKYLGIDSHIISEALKFLIKSGLVIQKGKKLSIGPHVTHIGNNTPFVRNHHSNWRLRAMQAQTTNNTEEDYLSYTGPMVLSEKDAMEIRKILVETVSKSTSIAKNSKSETLRCLNIDWFRVS